MEDKLILPSPLSTPVLFLIFNRPDTTKRVFSEIKKAEPKKLFIAADGPRKDKEGEKEKCEQARKIIKDVNWDCEVKTLFRDRNLGCKIAVSSAIDWFFKNVEEGIILEDDCLPAQSFFWFCQELLNHYRNDMRIMHISGNNFQFGNKRGKGSYYFSIYPHVWGWATWKRAWEYFNIDMNGFDNFKELEQIKNIFPGVKQQQEYWMNIFQKTFDGDIDSWAYIWAYSCFTNSGLCINPNVNLVSNIGFSKDALHTKDEDSIFANLKTEKINELVHPKFILLNKEADYKTSKMCYGNQIIFNKIGNRIVKLLRRII
jgi:hypothetical protein